MLQHRIGKGLAPIAATLLGLMLAWDTRAAETQRPTAADIVKRLSAPAPPAGLTRGFTPNERGISVEAATTQTATPSVSLEVNFEYNSAQLTTDAMLTLDQLGKAFNDPALAGARFQIAGHTDGKGSAAYNQKLSERRAAAVKAYVVAKQKVIAGRLDTVGFGKTQLLDPQHPDAAINRRVQVTKLGG
jgi:outer membrane protein OmpA-like peptidoglycan-associated protein